MRSGPAVSAIAVDSTTGKAVVTPPLTGGPWVEYRLTACEAPNNSTCLSVPNCLVTATSCPIAGCTPGTTYNVMAWAQKPDPNNATRTLESLGSNTDDFLTPGYGLALRPC